MENSHGLELFVCQVSSIWAIKGSITTEYAVQVTQFKPIGISPFYDMMQYVSTEQVQLTQPKHIKTTLNLQHNCYLGHFRKKITKKEPDQNHEGTQIEYLI